MDIVYIILHSWVFAPPPPFPLFPFPCGSLFLRVDDLFSLWGRGLYCAYPPPPPLQKCPRAFMTIFISCLVAGCTWTEGLSQGSLYLGDLALVHTPMSCNSKLRERS